MAAMGRLAGKAHSRIEQLPEVERQKVVDALIEGRSLREVAKLAGISHVQVMRYKKDILVPAIRAAQKVQALQSLDSPNKPTSEIFAEQANLTKHVVESSLFRERLEKLWRRTEKALDRAETAVRLVKDSTGADVVAGPDVAAIAPILNQAHKNVHMLGLATGEIEASAAVDVGIQIVMPNTPSAESADMPEGPVFNIALPKR
jgi:hypothetical protein